MSILTDEIAKRRTFAIISHPDAGKTTLTEKLLLFGGAIHIAGAVKSNKIKRTATSDWMEIEKQRGISVATSVMVATVPRAKMLWMSLVHQSISMALPVAGVAVELPELLLEEELFFGASSANSACRVS